MKFFCQNVLGAGMRKVRRNGWMIWSGACQGGTPAFLCLECGGREDDTKVF